MKSKEFLQEIRRAENLEHAVLTKLEVEGNTVTFCLVTDRGYSGEDVAYASSVAARYVPAGFCGKANVRKSVPSEEGVRRAVADILAKRFPAIAAFVVPEEIRIEQDPGGGRFYIPAGENDRALLAADGALDRVHEELERMFCGTWYGEFRFSDRERGEVEQETLPPAERILAPRFFPVTGFEAIDGASPQRAIYIADLTKETAGVTVCGSLTYFEERVTKTGKPYFSLTVTDGTGSLRCSYFSKKATLEKVRALKAGTSVCLTGDNELFNGALSFRVRQIDLGAAPEGFVPEARPSRPVPAQYRAVFPAPASDLVQGGMFGETAVPESVARRKFVVFDIETTGLNANPASGMDRIIELGAAKIEDGRISERFSTFVACPVRLPEEIVRLTGITDDMLVGAPAIGDVVADFFRFCDGAELVAHNGFLFDFKFIRYYGEKEGFLFSHRMHDTLLLSQELLRLSNYKLDTIAAYYGFTFNHHRAYDDAFVTAKIFLELAKKKGGI